MAWVAVFGVGLGSTWAAIGALVATIAAVVLGLVVGLRAEPRSADAVLGVAGAALAGLLLLYAAVIVVASLLGWVEWR